MRPDQLATAAAMAAAIAVAAMTLTPPAAHAHPLDEVVQAAYVTLAPGEVQLDLEIQPGSLVAAGVARAMDANGDGRISDGEARAYAARVLQASTLTLDGVPAPLRLLRVQTPSYANLARGDILHIFAVASTRMRPGPAALRYANRFAPVKSQCQANIFLSVGGGWNFTVERQDHSPDGRQLDVAYRVGRGA
jgi:hypothetical protein